MRKSPTMLLLGGLLTAGGCTTTAPTTQPALNPAVTAAPSASELPTFAFREDVLPARIGIEAQNTQPVRQLVFLEPELPLTPEEEKALGIQKPRFDPLEFYRPAPSIDVPQWPFDHRLNAITFGVGGSGARPFGLPTGGVGAAGRASVGESWAGPPSSVSGSYAPQRPISGAGKRGGVDVRDGPPSATGSRHDRSQP